MTLTPASSSSAPSRTSASVDSEETSLKATIVLEHIIQVADVSHTMQHWNVYKKWNERWQNQQSCRQTKIFLPSIDRGKSKKILELNKFNMGILVRHITGHAHLDKHRKTMGDYPINKTVDQAFLDHINGEEPVARPTPTLCGIINEVDIELASSFGTCRLCKIEGNEETPAHIILNCPYTWQGRAELFNLYEPTHIPKDWEPAKLVTFLARYNAEDLG